MFKERFDTVEALSQEVKRLQEVVKTFEKSEGKLKMKVATLEARFNQVVEVVMVSDFVIFLLCKNLI